MLHEKKTCKLTGTPVFASCAICASLMPSVQRIEQLARKELMLLSQEVLDDPCSVYAGLGTSALYTMAKNNIQMNVVSPPRDCARMAAEQLRLDYDSTYTRKFAKTSITA